MRAARVVIFLGVLAAASPFFAFSEAAPSPPEVPEELKWQHALDLELFLGRENEQGAGLQSGRLKLHYLDPTVQAFVGMQTGVTHANRDFILEVPSNDKTGSFVLDMGAHIGFVRSGFRGELYLGGVTSAGKLGFSPALSGEWRIVRWFGFYFREQVNIFSGDFMGDCDQGLLVGLGKGVEIRFGYRWLPAMHDDHSGARAGLFWRFQNPKIPYIFPSIG